MPETWWGLFFPFVLLAIIIAGSAGLGTLAAWWEDRLEDDQSDGGDA